MKLERNPPIEILYMASIYRSHYIYDLAIKMLRELIEMNAKSSAPDYTWVAIAQYNLAEVYSDQGNFILAKEMYKQAAESWCKVRPRSPDSMMWYSAALLGLQKHTDRLIEEAHLSREREDTA
jgi:tetratricopeptide (TPR) repeat protein